MTETGVVVARAALADVAAVVPLFEAYRAFYKKPPDAERAEAFLRQRVERDEAVVFLARVDGRAVGFTLLYPLFSSTRLRSLWLLNDLYVAADSRGGGIGMALLAHARSFAQSAGAVGITLRTALDNAAAQRLYERSGYSRNDDFLTYELTC